MKPPPYFGPHIERWSAAGFAVDGAMARYQTFKGAVSAAETAQTAARIIHDYMRQERAFAAEQGVPPDDPDLWRIDAMPKYIEWRP